MATTPAQENRATRVARVAYLLPAVLFLGAGTAQLTRPTLWRDEFATRDFSALSIADLLHATSHVDRSLLPYYLFVHAWRVFGSGPLALRLPSLLAVTAALVVIGYLATQWWGPIAGVGSTAVLAGNGSVLRMATEARPYAGALLCCALGTALLARAITTRRRPSWLAYALVCAVGVLLNVFTVLVLIAHATFLLINGDRQRQRAFALAAVLPIVAAVALVAASHSQSAQISWIPMPGLSTVPDSAGEEAGLTHVGFVLFALVILAAAAAAAAAAIQQRRVDAVWIAAAVGTVGPAVVLFAASHITGTPVLIPRYLVAEIVAFALLAGGAVFWIERAAQKRMRTAAACLAVVALVISVVPYLGRELTARIRSGDNYSAIAAELRAHARPGDTIVVVQDITATGLAAGLAYYADDRSFAAELRDALLRPPVTDLVRSVQRAVPLRTIAATTVAAGAAWVVGLDGDSRVALATLTRLGCRPAASTTRLDLHVYGDLVLGQAACK